MLNKMETMRLSSSSLLSSIKHNSHSSSSISHSLFSPPQPKSTNFISLKTMYPGNSIPRGNRNLSVVSASKVDDGSQIDSPFQVLSLSRLDFVIKEVDRNKTCLAVIRMNENKA